LLIRTKTHERFLAEIKERYEAQITEIRRTADILAEQVEYLRMTRGLPAVSGQKPQNPTEQPPMFLDSSPYMSEDEEDLRALQEAGVIGTDQLEKALEEIGLVNHQIEISHS